MNIPHLVAMALQADGWFLRQTIIWQKLNPMPESVRDRCTKAHEYVFLLTKSVRYFYDSEAISEPVASSTVNRLSQKGLAMLRRLCPDQPPNNHGRVEAIDGDTVMVEFPLDGGYEHSQSAPYPRSAVRRRG